MLQALLALMILPGFSPQEATEKTPIPSATLERVYSGYDPVTGLVRDEAGVRAPRLILEQPAADGAARLLLIARFEVDANRQPVGSGASSRELDLVLLNSSAQPIATGLNLFQVDGHSSVKVDEHRYLNLQGVALLGILEQHVNQGVDGWTLHVVRLTPRIQTVLSVPVLFSDCGAPLRDLYPDRETKKSEVMFAPNDPSRLEITLLQQTCEGKEISRSTTSYAWNNELGQYTPNAAGKD